MSIGKKICILGDCGVGKTSLLRRYVYSAFTEDYKATLGVSIHKYKDVATGPDGEEVELTQVLWDLEGSKGSQDLSRNYVLGAAGALIVCDLTRTETIDSLKDHARYFLDLMPGRPVVFALNKYDLVLADSAVPDLSGLTAEFDTHFEVTSAKTGEAVPRLFKGLAGKILTVGS